MRESRVEKHLAARVTEHGGEVRKVRWVGRRNAPDRLVLLRGVHFVELKRPGKEPNAAQAREIERLERYGASVTWLNTIEGVDNWIERIIKNGKKKHV